MTEWKIVALIVFTIAISALSLPIEIIWGVDSSYMKISWTIVCIWFISLVWFILYSINKD